MNRIALCLAPLDVLFFRDGRPFDAATKVTSGLPTPQVLAGAVRTALLEKNGCDFAQLSRSTKDGKRFADGLAAQSEGLRWIAGVKFRGPWLCALPKPESNAVPDVLLPVPATVHTGKKGQGDAVRLLKPLAAKALPGWNAPTRPLWLKGTDPSESATGFLNSVGLKSFLHSVPPQKDDILKPDELYGFDTRTGIGVNGDTFTAGDGEIYGIRFLALKPGIGFYAELDLPDGAATNALAGIDVLAFGGEGKRVALRAVEPFEFPEPRCEGEQKRFVLLTTPGIPNERYESEYRGAEIVAAAVNSPVAISGWDIAKGGPKPTRFAPPAGSVYFLNTQNDVPEPDDEFGYGRHLLGVWTDE